MAAYASSVVIADAGPQRISGSPIRVLRGTLTVSNYNSTLVEIAGITGRFRTTPTVILGGVFSGGNHVGQWNAASKSVKAWVTTTGAEVANDVNIGSVQFVAFGVAP